MSIRVKQLARNIYSQWLLQIVRLIAGFIITAFVARVLGPEGYGVAASVFVFANIFWFISDLGLSSVGVRYISVYHGSGRDFVPIVAGLLLCKFFAGTILSLIFYVLSPLFVSLVGIRSFYISAFQVYAMSVFLGSIHGVFRTYLYGIGRIDLATLYYTIGFVIGQITSLTLVLKGAGVLGYVVGYVVGDFTQLALYAYSLQSLMAICLKTRLADAVKGFKTILPLGLSVFGSKTIDFLYTWFDQVLVLATLGVSSLGVYSIALRFTTPFETLRQSISTALTPYYGELYGVNGVEALRSMIKRVSKLVFLTYIPAVLALVSLTPILIPLIYGEAFIHSWPIAFVHMIFLALTSFITVYSGVPIVVEAKKEIVLSSISRSASSIGIELLLVFIGLGALGVIVGKNFGFSIAFLYLYLTLYRKYELVFDVKHYGVGLLTGTIVLGIAILFSTLKTELWYVSPLAMMVTYIALLQIMKPLDKTDINIFREALGSRFNRLLDVIEEMLT